MNWAPTSSIINLISYILVTDYSPRLIEKNREKSIEKERLEKELLTKDSFGFTLVHNIISLNDMPS